VTKYLVTGGAGFVGTSLCERLLEDESTENIWVLDNFSTGSFDNCLDNVEYFVGHTKNISTILDESDVLPDVVFHLGEYSRVEQSFDDIDTVWESNKVGTWEVLKYVRELNKIKPVKLIYAGSSTKFSHTDENFIQSPYAWSKASNTELVSQFCKWFSIDFAITYFYNVYGSREISVGPYSTLIGKYKEAMRQGNRLNVVSPGTQMRNFTHIDDIIDAMLLIAEKGHGDEYGIGSDTKYSVLEVAKMFDGLIMQLPPRKGNRMDAALVTDKTKALGWSPKKNLKDYIETLRENGWK
jgi:UDP-glucose 4-epimerase